MSKVNRIIIDLENGKLKDITVDAREGIAVALRELRPDDPDYREDGIYDNFVLSVGSDKVDALFEADKVLDAHLSQATASPGGG